MKKKSKIILAVILGFIVAVVVLILYRYYSNMKLAEELRAEADAWLASLPKIPESENGAPVLNEGVGMLEEIPDSLWDNGIGRAIERIDTDEHARQLKNYLERNAKAFEKIEKALGYDNWLYTTDFEKGIYHTRPDYHGFILLRTVTKLKGSLTEYEGRYDDALRDYLKFFDYARTAAGERLLVSRSYICYGMSGTGAIQLLRILQERDFSPELQNEAIKTVELYRKALIPSSEVYNTEYYQLIIPLADFLKTISLAIETEYCHDTGSIFRIPAIPTPLHDYSEDIEVIRRWRDISTKYQPEKYYEMPGYLKNDESFYENIGIDMVNKTPRFAEFYVPSFQAAAQTGAEHITIIRGVLLTLAIKLNQAEKGKLPETLDKITEIIPKGLLTDPFSGRNLIYRREGDDFYLYSAGYNGVDDKCRDSRSIYEEGVDRESVPDIVFHKPPASGK